MATRLGRGHCGAHLTLLFTVEDESDEPECQGSIGSGICLEHGVEAVARGEDGGASLTVSFLDGDYDPSMYEDVLEFLSSDIPEAAELIWELNIRMSLPASQGFGMSASGAIAAAMAFQRAMGIPNEECVRRSFLIAHFVERKRSSGLGDTTALAAGGVERRISAGSPFSGELLRNGPGVAEGWSEGNSVLLCWRKDTGAHTSNYIDDNAWKIKISDAGRSAMDVLGSGNWDKSRWGDLIGAAKAFSRESGLVEDVSRGNLISIVEQEISNCGLEGRASALLCMLGESVVVLQNDLSDNGEELVVLAERLRSLGMETKFSKVGRLG